MVQVHHRTATVQGHRVFYREAGPAGAPVVLLLHGFPTSSRMFRHLIPALADRYHVLAPDHIGFGQSATPPPTEFTYTFDALADVTAGLLDQLGVDRFAMYVQDYGAPIGWRLALRRPAAVHRDHQPERQRLRRRLRRTFWAAVWAYAQSPTPRHGGDRTRRPRARRHPLAVPHGVAGPDLSTPTPGSPTTPRSTGPATTEIQLALFRDYATNPPLYPAVHEYFRDSQVPLLAVWGAGDEIFGPAGAEAFARDLPDAEIHLLDGGHFLLESPLDTVGLHPGLPRPHRQPSTCRCRLSPSPDERTKSWAFLAARTARGRAVGRFLVPGPLPERILFAEPLRRRMRVRFGGAWIADSDDVVLLHEPGRYPVAYFPLADVAADVLQPRRPSPRHRDLGTTAWYTVAAGGQSTSRAPHGSTPSSRPYAGELKDGSPSPGGPWTPSTRRTSGSSATPPTATTASTSAGPAATSSSATATGSSPTPPEPAGPVRVRVRPPLVRPPRRRRRDRPDPGPGPDVLPIQGPGQLLRHRRDRPRRLVIRGRLVRGHGASRHGVVRAGQDRGALDGHPIAAGARPGASPPTASTATSPLDEIATTNSAT